MKTINYIDIDQIPYKLLEDVEFMMNYWKQRKLPNVRI